MSDTLAARLDALADQRGLARTRLVRQALEGLVAGVPVPPTEAPSREELLGLLYEKARQGHVAAIRTLLVRDADEDPRDRMLREFERMAADARERNQ